MRRRAAILTLLLLTCMVGSKAVPAGDPELIRAVQPRLTALKVKGNDLLALADKQVIVRQMASARAEEMAAFGAVLADASPAAFVESYRNMAVFRDNQSVIESGLFSATPNVEDLARLTIDDKDLFALKRCRVRDSDVKLSEAEIAKFQSLVGAVPKASPKLKAQITAEYKKMLVERARTYLAKGTAGSASFADAEEPVNVHDSYLSLAREQVASAGHCEHLYPYLESYPERTAPDSESFIYWAKQRFDRLKPVITLVHVVIHREGERTYIASKQIYSSHYTDGALSVAELIPFVDGGKQPHTLVLYWIRLQVDMLGGALNFMKKRMAQPKMLQALKESLHGIRLTMESTGSARQGALSRPTVGGTF